MQLVGTVDLVTRELFPCHIKKDDRGTVPLSSS